MHKHGFVEQRGFPLHLAHELPLEQAGVAALPAGNELVELGGRLLEVVERLEEQLDLHREGQIADRTELRRDVLEVADLASVALRLRDEISADTACQAPRAQR